MQISHVKYIFGFLLAMLFYACAQINPLQGGAKDKYAPAIDSSGTKPLSGQINFTDDEIVIKFQEYIALNNPKDNIIITPQLKEQPDISAKNKKVTIRFNEELEENTTYTISFNHAITDITEKNDSIFQFVFSTGDYIDSLEVEGHVSDAFTNKPEEGFLVGLYRVDTETQYDSVPFLDQPVYITQTSQTGVFKMGYLKEGEYYIFTVKDENKNLKLDPSEKRGFSSPEKINIGVSNEDIELYTYLPEKGETKLSETRFTYPGKLTFILTDQPDTFHVETSMNFLEEDTKAEDSLVYWLEKSPGSKMNFVINLNGEKDTIKPLYKGIPESGEKTPVAFTNNLTGGGKLLPDSQFELTASEPVAKFEAAAFHFMTRDSVEQKDIAFTIENVRTIVFDTLNEDITLLKIDSAACTSVYGTISDQETWISLKVLKPDYFGDLILNIDTLYEQTVLIELLNDKNEMVRRVPFNEKTVFEKLIPGKYQLRLIFDDNNDGKWSPGMLRERRMPERVIYNRELIDVKSKWEKEVDWIIQN